MPRRVACAQHNVPSPHLTKLYNPKDWLRPFAMSSMAVTYPGFHVNPHTFLLSHFHTDHWPCCKDVGKDVESHRPYNQPMRTMGIREKPGFQNRLANKARRLNRRVSVLEIPVQDHRPKSLLDQLPVELRLKVWELVVGDQALHLVCERGRIGTYTCDERCRSSGACKNWPDYDLANPFPVEAERAMEKGRTKRADLLSLPLTCQSM